MTDSKRTILLFGPQGSGKGTQGVKLSETLQLPLIVTGNIFRDHMSRDTELGQLAKQYINKGELVPNEVTNRMIEHEVAKPENANGCIIDGFPRSLEQAEALDAFSKVTHLLHISISDEEAVKRIAKRKEIEGRADDTEEALKKRLQIYHTETEPLLEHYRKQGVVFDIDGEQDIEHVWANVQAVFSL